MNKKMTKFTLIRLSLSGALLGMALVGVVGPMFGFDVSHAKDAVGGLIGAGTVALGFKLAHLA